MTCSSDREPDPQLRDEYETKRGVPGSAYIKLEGVYAFSGAKDPPRKYLAVPMRKGTRDTSVK
jgi:hypothetical protein